MAYVKKTAYIEQQKSQNVASLGHSVASSIVNSGISKIEELKQDRHKYLVQENYNLIMQDVDAKYQKISAEMDIDDREGAYDELIKSKIGEIDNLELNNKVKKDLREIFTLKASEKKQDVLTDIALEEINLKRQRDASNLNRIMIEENIDDYAYSMKVKFSDTAENAKSGKTLPSFTGGSFGIMDIPIIGKEDIDFTTLVVGEDANDYDKRMALTTHILMEQHAGNEEKVAIELQNRIPIMRMEQAKHDADLLFDTEFNLSNKDNWNFGEFYKLYSEKLETESYGGIKLSANERNQMREYVAGLYANHKRDVANLANDFIERVLVPQIEEEIKLSNENKDYRIMPDMAESMISQTPVPRHLIAGSSAVSGLIDLAYKNERLTKAEQWFELIQVDDPTEAQLEQLRSLNISLTDAEKTSIASVRVDQIEALKRLSLSLDRGEPLTTPEGEITAEIKWRSRLREVNQLFASGDFTPEKLEGVLSGMSTEENSLFGDRARELRGLAKNENIRNAFDAYNELVLNETNTIGNIESLIKEYGLDNGQYNDILVEWKREGEERLYQNALKAIRPSIADDTLTTDKVDKAFALVDKTIYGEQIANYLNIAGDENLQKAWNEFEDKNLFDKAMPEDVDAIIKKYGLTSEKHAGVIAKMKEAARENLHLETSIDYFSSELYIELKKRGISDASLYELGIFGPDDSFQYTLEFLHDTETEMKSIDELAKDRSAELRKKMIPEKIGAVDSKIETQVESIIKKIEEKNKVGATYDNEQAVKLAEYYKMSMDQISYNNAIRDLFYSGNLTAKTYENLLKVDVTKFNEHERKVQDGLDILKGYLKTDYERAYGKDNNRMTNAAIDASSSHLYSAFTDEIGSYLMKNPNATDEQIRGKVQDFYNKVKDDNAYMSFDGFIGFMNTDSTDMFKNLAFGGVGAKESYEFFEELRAGSYRYYDEKVMNYLLSDSDEYSDSYGASTNFFGHLMSMKQRGATDKEVGQEIMFKVANTLGIIGADTKLVPVGSKDFDKQFKNTLKEYPVIVQNQIMQMSAMMKFTLDITDKMQKEILPEIVNEWKGETGNFSPTVIETDSGSVFGVNIGDKLVIFEPRNGEYRYLYHNPDGKITELAIKNSDIRSSENSLEHTLKIYTGEFANRIGTQKLREALYPTITRASRAKPTIDRGVVIDELQKIADAMSRTETVKKVSTEYLNILNASVTEVNTYTGKNNPYYDKIEFYIAEEYLDSAITHNTINTIDLRDLIKFRAIVGK